MIQVSLLTKEERIETICKNIIDKDLNMSLFSPQYTTIDPVELMSILELIEDRIYYISDSPSFEYQNKIYQSGTFRINSPSESKTFMGNFPDSFFIIYSIKTNQMVISNAPGISQTKSYDIIGVFIKDPLIIRQKVINNILDEK
jgi:hypothetical protein